MDISPLNSAARTAAADPALTPDQEELSNQFLRLLTAQIENQDPLDPLDGNQFVDQLATISSLEQQVESNRQLGEIVALLRGGETEA